MKTKPYTEGSLRAIYEMFLFPLMKHKKDSQNPKTFLEETVFHVSDRIIQEYTVTEEFSIPGLFLLRPRRPIQGIGYREVRKGQMVLIRYDLQIPDENDVQVLGGSGDTERVFRLTDKEVARIKPFLKLKKRMGRPPKY